MEPHHLRSEALHKSEISLCNAAPWFQPFVKDFKTILQIFCLHLFSLSLSLSDVSHDGLHLSSVNLLPLAVINDNVMKSLSGGKKKEKRKTSGAVRLTNVSRGCMLFWSVLLLSVGNCHHSSAAELSQHHSRCKVVGLQRGFYFFIYFFCSKLLTQKH